MHAPRQRSLRRPIHHAAARPVVRPAHRDRGGRLRRGDRHRPRNGPRRGGGDDGPPGESGSDSAAVGDRRCPRGAEGKNALRLPSVPSPARLPPPRAEPRSRTARPPGVLAVGPVPGSVSGPAARPATRLAPAPRPAARTASTSPEQLANRSLAAARPRAADNPAPAGASDRPNPAATGRFTIQVAAFRDRAAAERMLQQLAARGIEGYLEGTSAGIFRVRVGQFESREEARTLAARLESEQFATLVTSR